MEGSAAARSRSASEVGEYRIASTVEGDQVGLVRELTVKAARIPPSSYPEDPEFFADVARGDASMLAFERRAN